jgi:hypothetical protein
MIKINAEGSEPEILKGSAKTLKRSNNLVIIFEAWNEGYYEKSRKILEKYGYKSKKISDWGYMAAK